MYEILGQNLRPWSRGVIKILLVMKLTILLLLIMLLQVKAEVFAQKVTLSERKTSLSEVFEKIRKQTGYDFLVTQRSLERAKPVTINVNDTDIKLVLDEIFETQDLNFSIKSRSIVVTNKEQTADNISVTLTNSQADIEVSGRVVDEHGNAIVGATIKHKTSSKSTMTGQDGKFTLTVDDAKATLVVSFIGYDTQEVIVTSGVSMLIKMKEFSSDLDAVVVVGYGTQKKGSLTGAIAAVDAKTIEDVPASNLTAVLAGRLSGVNISQNSGKPGGSSSLSIRAEGTWNNTEPLYVIDGVIRDKFAFDALDPTEVENLSVLKDGASSAIYGSRAANGVVLVSTKKGKIGKPRINYSGSVGIADATKIPEMFNAYEQAIYANQRYINELVPLGDSRYYAEDELAYFKENPGYNWLEQAWKTPIIVRNSVNVSGGTEKVKYFLAGSHYNETGTFKNLEFDKYSFRSNVEAAINDYLTASLGFNLDSRDDNKPYWKWDNDAENMSNLYNGLLRRSLFEPYINGMPNGTFIAWHPLEVIEGKTGYNRKRYSNYEVNLGLTYKIPFVKGLEAKLTYNKYDRHEFIKQFNRPYPLFIFGTTGTNNHIPTDQLLDRKIRDDGDFLYEKYNRSGNYQFNAMLTYNNRFGKHDFSGLFVYEQAEGENDWFDGQRNYFISSTVDQLFAGSADPKNSSLNGSGSEFGRISYVGRLGYTYDNKYILETSFRYDGSVNFAPGHRWGFFPSASGAWRISEEGFFKEYFPSIDGMKLRGSIGLLGNDAVGGWQWMQRYKFANGAYFGALMDGVYADVMPNRVITWEKSLSYDYGLDFQTLNNRLSIGVGGFYRHTYDILGNRLASLPTTFGANMPAENYAKINTIGMEAELSFQDKIGEHIKYRIGGNFAYAKNKLIEKDEAENIRVYRSELGFNTDRQMGYVATDIIRSQADLDALPEGYTIFGMKPELGMLNYRDLRGVDSDTPDGKIDVNDQDWVIKHTRAPINYGFFMGASWKTFSLDLYFQGRAGGERFYDQRTEWGDIEAAGYAYVKDYWTTDNVEAAFPRAGSNNGADVPSTFWIQNTSFLRLKNLNISYTFPKTLLSKSGNTELKMFFMGTNLFLLQDRIKAYDPENESIMAYPMMKSYSLGVNLSF
ncbi:TonB-dependent receptor [Sphingobacterium sp. UT-1RO-CII-1]|uniref:TonB-dependent receptor n=1 Tax=Sphingobacterium sp. UT-1RO-CII-1 TaxID=2995225 RepID=UPI00227C7B9C|nr:TonB-dependent receptor [Sphingobacterium sp. UT-1RO-CII-1]MCY4780010.1 TonB-dependent receptor [Sphingobacterium sp. UT-1RO-CII-1]